MCIIININEIMCNNNNIIINVCVCEVMILMKMCNIINYYY